jgi:hypothetical protein
MRRTLTEFDQPQAGGWRVRSAALWWLPGKAVGGQAFAWKRVYASDGAPLREGGSRDRSTLSCWRSMMGSMLVRRERLGRLLML